MRFYDNILCHILYSILIGVSESLLLKVCFSHGGCGRVRSPHVSKGSTHITRTIDQPFNSALYRHQTRLVPSSGPVAMLSPYLRAGYGPIIF